MLLCRLDEAIAPMVQSDGAMFNERWGHLSRAGVNDKSQLTRQIEKYADVYTSRVSNFQRYTPFQYFRFVILNSVTTAAAIFALMYVQHRNNRLKTKHRILQYSPLSVYKLKDS